MEVQSTVGGAGETLIQENQNGGAYDNHRSMRKCLGEILRGAMSDVVVGRAIVFKVEDAERRAGLRNSPVGVVKGHGEIRVIHELIFKGPWRGAGGQSRWPVNNHTDWAQVTECELHGVLDTILKRILES